MDATMNTDATGSRLTYVVGIDSSDESDRALEWVRVVAGDDDRIVAVHAWQSPVVTGYDMVVTVDAHEIERAAKEWLADKVAGLSDHRVVPVVRAGHAGRAVVAEADERAAAMVVVAHRGASRISLMLGSTANYVLHHTERPVVVVRGDNVTLPKRVTVGVDDHGLDATQTGDSAENAAVRALRWAMALPGVEEVKVVHAWFLPAVTIGMFASVTTDMEEMDAAARRVAERVVELAGPAPAGIKVYCEPVRGTPGFALIEESRSVDLVVVGSRGRGGFTGLVLGSTTTEVAAHSHAPMAVVR